MFKNPEDNFAKWHTILDSFNIKAGIPYDSWKKKDLFDSLLRFMGKI